MRVEKADKIQQTDEQPGWKKGLWFVGLWLAGVLVLTVIGSLIRLALG